MTDNELKQLGADRYELIKAAKDFKAAMNVDITWDDDAKDARAGGDARPVHDAKVIRNSSFPIGL